jgi:hypothetical protein
MTTDLAWHFNPFERRGKGGKWAKEPGLLPGYARGAVPAQSVTRPNLGMTWQDTSYPSQAARDNRAFEQSFMASHPGLRQRRDALSAQDLYQQRIDGGMHPADAVARTERDDVSDRAELRRIGYNDDEDMTPAQKRQRQIAQANYDTPSSGQTMNEADSSDSGGMNELARPMDLAFHFNPLEARGKGGQWVKLGQISSDVSDTAALAGKYLHANKGVKDATITDTMLGVSRTHAYHDAADKLDKLASKYAGYGPSTNKSNAQQREIVSRLRKHAADLRALPKPDEGYTARMEAENRRLEDQQFQRALAEPSMIRAEQNLPNQYSRNRTAGRFGSLSMVYGSPVDLAAGSYRPPMVPRYKPTSARRKGVSVSMRKLAAGMKERHPDMGTHQHILDAAAALDRNEPSNAIRHLQAGIGNMTPQSLRRHGLLTDDQHDAAKDSMDAIHRHLLLVKDIEDTQQQNNQLPHAGQPGVKGTDDLTDKPSARPGEGDRAMNAPATTNVGRIDINVSKPQQVTNPKAAHQIAASNNGDLTTAIELGHHYNPAQPRGKDGKWTAAGVASAIARNSAAGKAIQRAANPMQYDGPEQATGYINRYPSKPKLDVNRGAVGTGDAALKRIAEAQTGWRAQLGDYDRAVANGTISWKVGDKFADSYPGKAEGGMQLQGFIRSKMPFGQLTNGDLTTGIDLSALTPGLASTPHPFGKPGGPGLWHQKGMELPPYIQNIARAILRQGRAKDLGSAIAIAKASTAKWAATSKHPEVRAASAATNADWNAKRAIAHAHANVSALARAIELTGTAAGASKDSRVPAGSPGGGTFGQGGNQQQQKGKPTAHQQHMAHVAHLKGNAAKKAALLATASSDRAKAAGLIKQRNVLVKALASASGKTTKGQAGAKTAANKTTAAKTTTAATSTAATTTSAKTTTTTAKTAAKKTTTAASTAKASVAQLRAQIAQLNTQINGLLAAATQAQAQAMKL